MFNFVSHVIPKTFTFCTLEISTSLILGVGGEIRLLVVSKVIITVLVAESLNPFSSACF